MSKVLTYHKSQNGTHWFKSVAYGKNEIEAIKDPQGGDTKQAPTSIPSPFARYDLVRTAFANLTLSKSLKGTPNDEKLVSEAFDLGELLFNYEDFKNRLKLVAWSRKDLETLLSPSSPQSHQRLGEALQLYLEQDADAYNFNEIQRLIIVFFRGVAIGGTSPSTLFFSSAEITKHLSIPLGNQHLFDGNPCPLYKRDIEYQKMWYCLKKRPGFQKRFKEVDDYLEISLKLLNREYPALYHKHIRTENGEDLLSEEYYTSKFDELTTGGTNDLVEIVGFPLRKKRITHNDIEDTSGFVIKTSKYKQLYPDPKFPIPLALQKNFRKTLPYTQGNWNPDTEVLPYYEEDWRKNLRRLPGQSTNYPWLTISDFLEPYLVRVNYPINTEAYLTGTLIDMPEFKGYLLPLKKDFFDFFGFDDLEKGRVRLSMQGQGGGGVKVTLQIPIESRNGYQEYISFERTYIPANPNDLPKPNLLNNEGFIIEQKFTVNIYPLVRAGEYPLKPDYRIQLIEQKTNYNEDIRIDFIDFADNKPVEIENEKYRNPRNSDRNDISKYYVLKNEFDYLSVQFKNPKDTINAVLVPKWFKYNGRGQKFSFAIDFGTSNTHIEFKTQNTSAQRFSIDKLQIGTLVSPNYYNEAKIADIALYFPLRFEFLPLYINDKTSEGFPLRTAIVYSPDLDLNKPTYTLADFNIPFYYEQEPSRSLSSDETSVNLKWAPDNDGNNKKVTAFFEELLLMIRNKVVFEGGNLNETKIYWFYPSSMQKGRIKKLKRIWDDLFKIHITDKHENNPLPVSESIAPFYHYKARRSNLVAADKPALSIDIGGGTTDVVVYKKTSPVLLTSFRFAGNAIYGDAFISGGSDSNGFVVKYTNKIATLLESNKLQKLLECHNKDLENKKSEEIISLWFALEKNKSVKNPKDLSFNRMLADDDDLKIVFVFFYTAIIYHVAKLLKNKGFEMPKSISFSGTGSKLMDILTADDDQLTSFTKAIIEKVYDQVYDKRDSLAVFCDRSTPKEATCKGALVMSDDDLKVNPQDIAEVYTATYDEEYPSLNYEDINRPEVKKSVLREVENFIDFFFSLNKTFDFYDELSVSPEYIRLAKEVIRDNLSSYLTEGIDSKTDGLTEDDKVIEETLFFYPLIGAINNLAYQIGSRTKLN